MLINTFLDVEDIKKMLFAMFIGDAEIVSLDAFAKSQHGAGLTVGITFLKVHLLKEYKIKLKSLI